MALDAVVGEIRDKGIRESEAIKSEAKTEVSAILAEAREQVIAIKMAAEEEANRQRGYIMAQEVAAANLSVKRETLNARKDVLDEVFDRVVADIAALPDEFHRKAVRELCKSAAKELGEGVFYCNERDVHSVEDALSSLKTLSGFSLAGTKDITGGIIAESADGALQLDCSYSTFISEVWESGLKDASDILFG
ncbi:V-type ATP synthase subunit E family protein [Methanogenium sp. MK-MG]|uniref:V-type ATP synthase subunit E family protein n=1 Tax=Methanogenium sp. MK-MG TaxID=2599926 RepID=UPI0013EBF4DE|nr:V-type ATP synthase subunit E family protein [Methanogenium sp. MK-MG]KAF1077220.1 V-type ATP synthase subunit E [Methanogenium sp. MK-MG]